MQHIFRYLSEYEEHALLKKGGVRSFGDGEVIVEEGDFPNALFVIKSGRVLVKKRGAGASLQVSELGEGDIFGEMSFLEHIPASASVVAGDRPVEAFVIERTFIERLLESNMDFLGRFYKSLAEILSQRLRDTSALAANMSKALPEGEGG
jgi:CRP/FNR family cyclic AMP-dependent transcriptional regulator